MVCVWTTAAYSQTDRLPANATSTQQQGYLVNPTDTLSRQTWLYYGNRKADRMVRYPELLRTYIVNQQYAKHYADSLTFVQNVNNYKRIDSLKQVTAKLNQNNTFSNAATPNLITEIGANGVTVGNTNAGTFFSIQGIGNYIAFQNAAQLTRIQPVLGASSYIAIPQGKGINTNYDTFATLSDLAKFSENGSSPTQSRTNAQNDSTYIVHFPNIAQMQAYSGPATECVVDAPGSGGSFSYSPAVNNSNTFSRFTAIGKGTGLWVRIYNYSLGIPITHDPRVQRSNINTSTLIPEIGYTENGPYIQQMLNTFTRKAIKLLIPHTSPGTAFIISGIKVGQNTTIEGQDAIHAQQTTSDTLKFSPLSHIVSVGGFISHQTDSNYRNQGLILRRLSITGSGKNNGYNGVDFNRNNAYAGANVQYRDSGVPIIEQCYIQGFSTPINLRLANDVRILYCHFQDYNVAIRGGKNSNYILRPDFFVGDTAAILKGTLNIVKDAIIEPGADKMGIIADSLNQSTLDVLTQNTSRGIWLRNGSYGVAITGRTVMQGGEAIRIENAGAVNGANSGIRISMDFVNQSTPSINIINTQRVIIAGSTWARVANGSHYAITGSGSSSVSVGHNDYGEYTDVNKINASALTILDGDYVSNPRIINNTASLKLYNPNSNNYYSYGTISGSINGYAYNNGAPDLNSQISFKAAENQSGSALGSAIDFKIKKSGQTSLFTGLTLDGSGLTLSGLGNTNAVKHFNAGFGSYDGEFMQAVNGNRNLDLSLFPAGTATTSRIRFNNSSNTSNYASLNVVAALDSAVIAPMSTGTPTTLMPNLVFGSTAQGYIWQKIYVRASQLLQLPSTTVAPLITVGKLKGGSATPAITSGTGAGAGAVVSISGTDLSGTITLTTGSSPVAGAAIATVTFNSAYATAPRKGGSPAAGNAATASLSGVQAPYYTTTTGALVLNANTTALAPNTTYVWDYTLTQ
ncbi:hypothetical protein GCM10027037_14880 [Mucilaginibacter koreensis]